MLGWAIFFFLTAITAGVIGFAGLAASLTGIAELMFYAFLVLFVITMIAHLVGDRAPRV